VRKEKASSANRARSLDCRDLERCGKRKRLAVHGYRFDLATGKCEHVPSLHLHLRRYKITMTGDEVWVDLL
jgi:hypothetical protein